MSFLIKDNKLWQEYQQIWDVIKNKLSIKFHSKPVYEYRYLKAKVREFDGVIKINYLGNDYDLYNKNHPQVYLEECKYKVKKAQMPRFINTELKPGSESSDSDLDSEKVGSKFDNELMAKLEKFWF